MARILVAEDEDSVRAFVARALAAAGHDVTTVADGGAALEAIAADSYDLLLTDIVMPVMDGIALALKVSAEVPDLKILLMSGYAAERQRAHNLDALIADVVVKPFTLREITAAVDAALNDK
ncbi:MAG: response regulator [Sphingomonadales bacterium]|nr:response regulator [Sphingomonadales bacterium]